jgi:RNA polymerase sigma factor (sigma-70 family)
MEPISDEMIVNLIKDAQKGKDAFEQLVRRYRHDVFRIIRVYTQNDSDAEDLAQDTWLKVYQSIGKLKEPYHLENWLRTVAVNTVKNWLKSRAYKESQATDEIEAKQLWVSGVVQYQRQKLLEQIRDAIDSLSTKNREVVLDFYICGYSASEISQRLSVPVSTVNSRLKEARKKLRKEFESMVAQSAIREKFAPDSLVGNVMDRVASLPVSSAPTGNIIQRIGRILTQSTLLTTGIATLIVFTIIGLIISNLQHSGDVNQKDTSNFGDRVLRMRVNMPIPPLNAPAQVPEEGQIVFHSDRDGNNEIYVMDTDGGNVRRLTNNPADDIRPVWSPDGKSIAFGSMRDGNWQIYLMSPDGKNQRRISNDRAGDPAWSPDGQKIAFSSARDGNSEIYVMDADGKNVRRLTNNPATDGFSDWSPDGQSIAFRSKRDGNDEIYVMDADGSNQRNLTNNPADEMCPAWSPDGQSIAFNSNRNGNHKVYIMDVDGSNPRRLTNNPANEGVPAWSPDGQRIAFVSERDGGNGNSDKIYVMDADGKNQHRLTNNPGDDESPDWFDPAFAPSASSPAGKIKAIWGRLKGNSE